MKTKLILSFLVFSLIFIATFLHAEDYSLVSRDFQFTSDLGFGFRGQDVENLQCIVGIEEPTGYFGPLTKQAVTDLQNAHKDEILTPLGLSNGTGFMGSSTRAYLNRKLSENGGDNTLCPPYEPVPSQHIPQQYPDPQQNPNPQPNPTQNPNQQSSQNPNQQNSQQGAVTCPPGYTCLPNQPTLGGGYNPYGYGSGNPYQSGGGSGYSGNPTYTNPDGTQAIPSYGASNIAGATITGIPYIGPWPVSCNPTAGEELHSYDCTDNQGHAGLTEKITLGTCPPLQEGWVCGKFAYFGGSGETGRTIIPNGYSPTLVGLKPNEQYYSAMRWNYYQISPGNPKAAPSILSHYFLQLYNPATTGCVNTVPVDWGPNPFADEANPRAYDLSRLAVVGLGNTATQDKTIIYGRLIPQAGNEVGLTDSCFR